MFLPLGNTRHPSLYGDDVLFTSEDDIWVVSKSGGLARRLTSGPGRRLAIGHRASGHVIYTGLDEGQAELFQLDPGSGETTRLTFTGGSVVHPIGFSGDGKRVLFSSSHETPHAGQSYLYWVSITDRTLERLPWGVAHDAALEGPRGAMVLGRHTHDPARWKRYRGGTSGQLWAAASSTRGNFNRLELQGNVARPMWVGSRLFFLSDQDGVGNIYSGRLTGASCWTFGHIHHRKHILPETPGRMGETSSITREGTFGCYGTCRLVRRPSVSASDWERVVRDGKGVLWRRRTTSKGLTCIRRVTRWRWWPVARFTTWGIGRGRVDGL